MTDNSPKDLVPISIIISPEDFDRIIEALNSFELDDEKLDRLSEILSRPSRIESGRYEIRQQNIASWRYT